MNSFFIQSFFCIIWFWWLILIEWVYLFKHLRCRSWKTHKTKTPISDIECPPNYPSTFYTQMDSIESTHIIISCILDSYYPTLLVLYNRTVMEMRRVTIWHSSYCTRLTWGVLHFRPVLCCYRTGTITTVTDWTILSLWYWERITE